MKKIILIMVLSALSLNGYSQDSTETIKTKSASFAVQNTTTTIKKTKLKIPKHISKEEQERMDKEAEEDRKEKLIPPLERMMRDSKKPCPPYYESKHMKMTLVKEFRDEEELQKYPGQHGMIKKRKQYRAATNEIIQLLDAEDKELKRFSYERRILTENEKSEYIREVLKWLDKTKADIRKRKLFQSATEIAIYYGTTDYKWRKESEFLQETKVYGYHGEGGRFEPLYPKTKIFDVNQKLVAEINGEGAAYISPDLKYFVVTDSNEMIPNGYVAFYNIQSKLLKEYNFGFRSSGNIFFSRDGNYVGVEECRHDRDAILFDRKGNLLWKREKNHFAWISDGGHVLLGNGEYINSKGDVIWHAKELGPLYPNDIYVNEKGERLISLGGAHNSVEIVLVDFRTGEILDEISWLLFRGTPTGFIGHQLKIEGNDAKIYLYDIQW